MVQRCSSTTLDRWSSLLAGTCLTAMAVLTAAWECPSSAHGIFHRDASFDDVMPRSPTLAVTSVSHVACAKVCLVDAQCDTFTYNADNGSCMGMPTRMPKQAEMTPAPGFRLYRRVPPCPVDQGYVYNATLQLCLKFHAHTNLHCYESEDYCKSKGDVLAILRTPAKINFVIDHVAALGGAQFIIGARRGQGQPWSWVDGTAVESAILNMVANLKYECLTVTGNGVHSMWATNPRFFVCRRDVTGF